MAEAVYNKAGLGLPIVMTLGNRAIGAPINIWNDHTDSMSMRDAGWDEELLRVEIESLQAADFDPLLTGFDEKELSKLFDDGIEAKEDDFDVDAELQKPTFTKPGDIWTLGRHRLICGDSTKEETYTALMDGRKANLVITDPPYKVNY